MERLTLSPTEPDARTLAAAADVLLRGGLVVFPTDTFYGLAADPRIPDAVARVFGVKGRAADVALPLVAASLEQVEASSLRVSASTRALARRFWPGPLTLVVDAGPKIAAPVHGGTGTVAIRVPDHAVARGLSASLGFPVVSTSANRSGRPAPRTADAAVESLGEDVELVLDSGLTPGGEPSTIVDARSGVPRLIRAGAVPFLRVMEAL